MLRTEESSLGSDIGLLTINDRILAAFPPALFSEDFDNAGSQFNKTRADMNLANQNIRLYI